MSFDNFFLLMPPVIEFHCHLCLYSAYFVIYYKARWWALIHHKDTGYIEMSNYRMSSFHNSPDLLYLQQTHHSYLQAGRQKCKYYCPPLSHWYWLTKLVWNSLNFSSMVFNNSGCGRMVVLYPKQCALVKPCAFSKQEMVFVKQPPCSENRSQEKHLRLGQTVSQWGIKPFV